LHRAVRNFRAGAFASAVAMLLCCGAATAAERLRVCLNWAPGADHAPLYHARQEGWFAAADVAVDILPGGQSADTLRRLAEGECEAAVADFGAVLSARAQDRDVVAVMAIGAHAPYAFYATDGSALRSPADLAGKRIAAYGTDPPRRLWGAFAARHGLALEAVHWIDLPNNAKVELGNVLVLPTGAVAAPASARFVALARRAWLACLSAPQPCLEALLAANTHLDPVREARKWPLAARSVAGTDEATEHLGCLDSARVRGTAVAWSLAKNVEAAATNHLLKQAGARCD